jgi:hypothetical protein
LPWQQAELYTRTVTQGYKRNLKGQLHLKEAPHPCLDSKKKRKQESSEKGRERGPAGQDL